MARVLLLSLSPIASDPRVMRQYEALSAEHEVHVMGFGDCPPGVRHFTPVEQPRPDPGVVLRNAVRLALRRYETYYWQHPQIRALEKAAAQVPAGFDLVLANDVMALPMALRLAGKAPVWLDAHEYAPREFEDLWAWRMLLGPFFDATCRDALPRVARMSTVCAGIAREYERCYGVPVSVMPNCPEPQALPVRPTQADRIRLIHHGAAIASRKIEVMIDLMDHLDDRFSLDLMLVEQDPAYFAALKHRAARHARIRFIPPVPMRDIAAHTNGHDIGLFLLPPTNFNYLHALPNKFFEFMQARLAIAIGPSPEMQALVTESGCGVVSGSFEAADLAAQLSRLTPENIDAMKHASDRASRRFNAAVTRQWLRDEVRDLLAGPTSAAH
ncbi:glycosyltransferase [Acidovorax sp. NCPPB 3576]|uniref:glycosyltransferase n=1 Tax=Acidovorax sp. NCPPB 3576 TaxID=2940488 RepID=UPI00234BECB9|nr:glycosyltransferase [Acidovorax sp. NCPPB 3576]WCM89334.1 glycosyltransferase [Acidovorax sp. NCPPB 3576]